MRRLFAAAVAVAVLSVPGSAEAHLVTRPKAATLDARAASQQRNLAHARYVCRRGGGQHRRWSCRARRWLARELGETRRSLRPPAPVIGWPWIAVADCETGDSDGRPPYSADWRYNGSSGFDGGLQFLPSTWLAAASNLGLAGRYPYAYLAPPAVQVIVARAWLARTSWLQWPACSAKIGLR